VVWDIQMARVNSLAWQGWSADSLAPAVDPHWPNVMDCSDNAYL